MADSVPDWLVNGMESGEDSWRRISGAFVQGAGKTVFRREGYSRDLERGSNGINLVQVPLQGTGIGQPVSCIGASVSGQCLGTAGVDPTTAFRIGADGLTAPLPAFVKAFRRCCRNRSFRASNGNAPFAGVSWVIDPNLKPASTDQFDFTIQRELSSKITIEVGYVGRLMRNEQVAYSMDAKCHT